MSKYTTEVRYICESNAGLTESKGYNDVENIIANSRTSIFDFNYPIYDEDYRSVLETKILKHYYTREIGLETVGLWKLKLNTKMNEIMPYYNQLYKSALLEFNPMYTTDLYKDGNRDTGGNSSGTENVTSQRDIGVQEDTTDGLTSKVKTESSKTFAEDTTTARTEETENNGTKRDKYSDTPQGSLVDLEADRYLTNARKITDDNNGSVDENITVGVDSTDETIDETNRTDNKILDRSVTTNDSLEEGKTNTNEFTNTEQYLEHVYGYMNRDASELLMKYRKTFLNIDLQIIDELEELFLHLW